MGESPTDNNDTGENAPEVRPLTGRSRLLVGVAVLVLFAIIVGARLIDTPFQRTGPSDVLTGAVPRGADPVASLDAALETGEPIVLLFHSGGCAPCIEMEATVTRVVPEYGDAITYVDAPTADSRTAPLFERFSFQYVPTTFFIGPGGEVVDQVSGAITDDEMRTRLDALIAAGE